MFQSDHVAACHCQASVDAISDFSLSGAPIHWHLKQTIIRTEVELATKNRHPGHVLLVSVAHTAADTAGIGPKRPGLLTDAVMHSDQDQVPSSMQEKKSEQEALLEGAFAVGLSVRGHARG